MYRWVLFALLCMKSAHGVLVCQTKIINKPIQSNHTHTKRASNVSKSCIHLSFVLSSYRVYYTVYSITRQHNHTVVYVHPPTHPPSKPKLNMILCCVRYDPVQWFVWYKKCVYTYGTPIHFCDTLFHGTALTTIYEELLKLTGRYECPTTCHEFR